MHGGHGGSCGGCGLGARLEPFFKSTKITSPPIFKILFDSIKISVLSKQENKTRFFPGTKIPTITPCGNFSLRLVILPKHRPSLMFITSRFFKSLNVNSIILHYAHRPSKNDKRAGNFPALSFIEQLFVNITAHNAV